MVIGDAPWTKEESDLFWKIVARHPRYADIRRLTVTTSSFSFSNKVLYFIGQLKESSLKLSWEMNVGEPTLLLKPTPEGNKAVVILVATGWGRDRRYSVYEAMVTSTNAPKEIEALGLQMPLKEAGDLATKWSIEHDLPIAVNTNYNDYKGVERKESSLKLSWDVDKIERMKEFIINENAKGMMEEPSWQEEGVTMEEALVMARDDIKDNWTDQMIEDAYHSYGGEPLTSSLHKVAALTPEQHAQITEWAKNPDTPPTFDFGGNLYKWLIDRNKEGDLREFPRSVINTMFGKAKNMMTAQEPKVLSPAEIKQQEMQNKVNAFISRYQNDNMIPVEALLEFVSEKDTPLYRYIQSFAMKNAGNKVPIRDLNNLYHSLVSTLKGHHINLYQKPARRYEAFPYTSYMSDMGRSDSSRKRYVGPVAGHGTQFAIALTPNYSALSPRMAEVFEYAMSHGSTHLQDAMAFSRVSPINYTIISTATKQKPIVLKVWAISEMQADDYQKINGTDSNFASIMKKKFGGGIVDEFREFYRHWPENLMNVIIEKAVENGVDQVWMPEGREVAIKTNQKQESGEPVDWSKYYDRAIKSFGGVLKNINAKLTLDPASSYDRKSSMFYVIDLRGKQTLGSLKLSWEIDRIGVGDEVRMKEVGVSDWSGRLGIVKKIEPDQFFAVDFISD